MGVGHSRETNHVIIVRDLSLQPLGEERELEIEFNHRANDSINYAYVMKLQQKLWILKLHELPWLAVLSEYHHILMLGG